MINKAAIIRIIEIFTCFMILILCYSVQANQLEIYLNNLHQDIVHKKKPAYAVSVTRIINNSKVNYLPLSTSKRFIIFSILNCFLGNQCDISDANKQITTLLNEEFERYQYVNKKRIAYISNDENRARATAKAMMAQVNNKKSSFYNMKNLSEEQLLFFISNKLKGQKENAILNLKQEQEVDTYINSIKPTELEFAFYDTLEKEDRELVEFWQKNTKNKVIEQYIMMHNKIASSFSIKHIITTNDNGVIVFNEMFFGKNVPFRKGAIEEEVKRLSVINPNKIFHVNFLTVTEVEFPNKENLKLFLNKNKVEDWRFYTGVQAFNTIKYENSYAAYIDRVSNSLQKQEQDTSILLQSWDPLLKVLENTSRIYMDGSEKAFYNKSSYQQEDDTSLVNGIFYVFGNGYDKLINSEVDQNIENIQPSFISTEICYDMELGIRHKFKSYPKNLTIHIVPSNTLPFVNRKGTLIQLPDQAIFVFHVDPQESALYKKIPIFSTEGLALKFHKIDDGMCSCVCQFELDESTYFIKAWDLSFLS